jgi:ankyrin repeat protein
LVHSLLIGLLLLVAWQRPPAPAGVVLSYEERPGMCANCPHFRVEFERDGIVRFHGLRGCAVPGEHTYRIPAAEFTGLLAQFNAAGFFTRPRTLPWNWTDSDRITLTYRDDRRVHETVRLGPQDPALTGLARRMRQAARLEALLAPSLAKYQELVRHGWDVNTLGDDHQNALTATIWGGDLPSAQFLLSRGSIVTDGAVMAAASRDEPEYARLLFPAMKEPGKRDLLGPALIHAAAHSDASTRELLAAGADANFRDPSDGRTPLIAAIQSGGLERVALLLARGASATTADRNGRSPLHAAAAAYNSGFITMLSRRGAPIDVQDREGRTPLMIAADGCAEWNVPVLLAAGARVDLADRRGRTARRPQTAVIGDPKCARTRDLIRRSARGSDIR